MRAKSPSPAPAGWHPSRMAETRVNTPWRRSAVVSFLILVLALVAWNVAAYAIGSSSLEQDEGSFGLAATAAIVTVIYGGLPLIVSLVVVLVAAFGGPGKARGGAWCIAVLSALCAAGLAVVAVLAFGGLSAEKVFGAVSVLLALVLLVPLILCVRRSRSDRHSPAGATTEA